MLNWRIGRWLYASTPIAHPSKAQAGDEEESARDRFEKELKAGAIMSASGIRQKQIHDIIACNVSTVDVCASWQRTPVSAMV